MTNARRFYSSKGDPLGTKGLNGHANLIFLFHSEAKRWYNTRIISWEHQISSVTGVARILDFPWEGVYCYGGERGLVVGRRTCNPEFPGSNPPSLHWMDLSSVAPNSTPPRLVNSQLVSLPPVGILNLLCLICIIFVKCIWSYSHGICAIKMLIANESGLLEDQKAWRGGRL